MPQQQEQGWAGKEWRDNLGVPFLCKLSHSWSSLDIILNSLGKPIQAQPEVGRVSRMGLEGEVPPWAGSPWMGSFTATLISGFAYPCKTKYHCWLISPELFPNCFSFESLGFGLSLKKNICAPSPKVSLYQLASDFPKLNFGCNNSQDGKMCSCPEICLSLLFIQDSDGNNSSHEIKKKIKQICFEICTIRKNRDWKKVHTHVSCYFQIPFLFINLRNHWEMFLLSGSPLSKPNFST